MTLLGKLSDLNELPCGVLVGEDGEEKRYDRTFSIQEMTGNVRKMIASRNVRTSLVKIVDTVLEECVTGIAGTEGKALRKGAFLRSLLIGDRDFLLLKIRRESKGNLVIATMTCPSCQEKLDVKIDLDQMDVYGLKEKDFMVDAQGRRIFVVNGDGVEADFRFPDGHDQAAIVPLLRSNPIEAQHRMYHRCLVRWKDKNGEKMEPFAYNFFDTLPIRMVDWVDEQFRFHMPGPEMETNITCEVCGAESLANMDSSDFLFPQTQTGKSRR